MTRFKITVTVENQLAGLKMMAKARREMLKFILDQDGAIQSAQRGLEILTRCVCFPETSEGYIKMTTTYKFTRVICNMIENNESDQEIIDCIRDKYKLSRLTPEEINKRTYVLAEDDYI